MSPYFAAEFTTNSEGQLEAKFIDKEGTMTHDVNDAKIFDSKSEADMEVLKQDSEATVHFFKNS